MPTLPEDDIELQLAAQQGLIPSGATVSPTIAQGQALANAILTAPNLPVQGNPDPNAPSGIPAYGVPIAPPLPPQAAANTIQAPLPLPEQASPSQAAPSSSGGGSVRPDGMTDAVTETQAAGQAATAVGQEGVDIAREKVAADVQADKVRADEAQAASDRLGALQAKQKLAYDDSVTSFQKAREEVNNFKFHDYFANKSLATLVLSGIGMLAGGASYDSHHVNQAVNIIQTGMDRDAKQQLDYLHSKEHIAELAQQGIRDTQSYLAHEMANFSTAEALKKEAVARQIDMLSSTTRGKLNVNEAQTVAAKLRESAAKDAQTAIIQGTHNRVMQSEIALNRAKAANEGINKTTKIETRSQEIADKVVKANLTKDKTVTTLLKEKQEYDKALAASVPDPKTGRVNGTAFQGAIDGFTKAITGLGARQGSIAMTTGAFGGVIDKIKRNVQKGIDGTYTAHDVQVFREGAEKMAKDNTRSLEVKRKEHTNAFARNPLTAKHKDIYESNLDQFFGAPASGETSSAEWKPVPRNLAGNAALKGKTQVLVGPDGSIQDAR